MIVEKFMCIGINSGKKLVEDVLLQNNSNSYSYNNNFNISFSIDKITNFYTTIETDHKKFINKQNAINHIRYLRTHYTDVLSWTIITVYDEIYDISEQRMYKLNKLRTKFNIR